MQRHLKGFSLAELSMSLLMVSLLAGFAFSLKDKNQVIAQNCIATTKIQLTDIRGAIERFARTNNRLPAPASRNLKMDDAQFGVEDRSGMTITTSDGVHFGALPFNTLGLDVSYAGDCWGNKLTYAVTSFLVVDNAIEYPYHGNIQLWKDTVNTHNTKIAFAVISHGEDQLGAVKLNQTNGDWCTSTGLASINCRASSNTLMDADFNDGADAGSTQFFDDIVVASEKPISVTAAGYVPPAGPPLPPGPPGPPPADCTITLNGVATALPHGTTITRYGSAIAPAGSMGIGWYCEGGSLVCGIGCSNVQAASCNNGVVSGNDVITYTHAFCALPACPDIGCMPAGLF